MVNTAVRRLGLLLFLLLPLPSSQAVSLSLTPSQTRIEQGTAFELLVEARDMEQPLETLDLSAIKKAFRVVARDYTKSRDRRRQILRLRLYPRLTGKVHLPALVAGPTQSAPLDIDVVAARANGQAIRLSHAQSASTVWERQPLRVMVEVQTADQFASLRLDADTEATRLPGFEIVPLPARRNWIDTDGKRRTRLRIGWLLYPLGSGKQTIELPAIDYHLGGNRQHRFYLPALNLQVRPLPPYIPPTLPVGKLSITSTISPAGLLRRGELADWTLHMQSDALLPVWFPPVLRQIRTAEQVQFFPARTTRQTRPDSTGLHSQVIHHLPFKPLNNGRVELPTLHFQYFDPDTGRLVDISHTPARPWTLSPLLQILLPLLLLAVLYRPLRGLWQKANRYRQRNKLGRQALHGLASAQSISAILQSLRQFARAEGWPQNTSLSAWRQRFESRYRPDPILTDCLQALSEACYGTMTNPPLEKLKTCLLERLTRRKARKTWWPKRHRDRCTS